MKYKQFFQTTFFLGCVGLVATSSAQDFYAGGGFAVIDYSEPGFDADLTAIYGRAGSKFNEYLSVELRLATGIGDDSDEVLGIDVDVELENFYGVYMRGGIPLNPMIYPYVVAGYTRGEVEYSALGFSDSESGSDFSYGIGVDVNINEKITLNIEYINYLDKNDVEVSGFGLGAVWLF